MAFHKIHFAKICFVYANSFRLYAIHTLIFIYVKFIAKSCNNFDYSFLLSFSFRLKYRIIYAQLIIKARIYSYFNHRIRWQLKAICVEEYEERKKIINNTSNIHMLDIRIFPTGNHLLQTHIFIWIFFVNKEGWKWMMENSYMELKWGTIMFYAVYTVVAAE